MENFMHGRQTTLQKLNEDRNNPELGKFTRLQADKAYTKIIEQLKDKKLMALREQLIKASQSGDQNAVWKITNQMREHEGKQREDKL